jgi:hypothetical protein
VLATTGRAATVGVSSLHRRSIHPTRRLYDRCIVHSIGAHERSGASCRNKYAEILESEMKLHQIHKVCVKFCEKNEFETSKSDFV